MVVEKGMETGVVAARSIGCGFMRVEEEGSIGPRGDVVVLVSRGRRFKANGVRDRDGS